MATFKYRAKESSGKTAEGLIDASTSDEAIEKINALGLLPVKVEEATSSTPEQAAAQSVKRAFLGRVKSKDITAFGRELASLTKSGVPILKAIAIIQEPSESPHFIELLNRIHEEIKNGAPLSTALGKFPHLFSPLYLALVSAGEKSGTLDQVLLKVTEHRQKQEEIISRVRTAFVYPIMMALTGAGTIIFMLTFVMPRLMRIFDNLGGKLPLPTQIVISASNGLRQPWVWGVVMAVVGIIAIQMRRKKKGENLVLARLKLGIPVLGVLELKSEIAKFSRTLKLLLRSGIPIIQAVESAMPVLGNPVFKIEFTRCLQDLKEGGSFGKSLRKSKHFPIFMANLIVVGEQSGRLDDALGEIALYYERETDEAIRAMTALMEPLMILVMGLIVGFIVIAMLLPLFELNMIVK